MATMVLRMADSSDLEHVRSLLDDGRAILRDQGCQTWQNTYPNYPTIQQDIKSNKTYIAQLQGHPIATFTLINPNDPSYTTYTSSFHGQWLRQGNRHVGVCRVAIRKGLQGRGYSFLLGKGIEKLCLGLGFQSVRTAVCPGNRNAVKGLVFNGYQYCGVLEIQGVKLSAFERVIQRRPSL